MKKANMPILASIFVMALVALVGSVGTTAWFSAGPVTAGQYTMNTATMTMALVETEPIIFDNLKPGEAFGPVVIKIKNTGTMDILYLCGSMEIVSNIPLADKIEIVDWYEYIPGWGWQDNLGADFGTHRDLGGVPVYIEQHFDQLVTDQTDPFTLLEAAQSYAVGRTPYPEPWAKDDGINDQFGNSKKYASDWVTGGGYDEVPDEIPAIMKGGTYQMVFYFKFHETAGDDLQTTSGSFRITFLGMQHLDQRP